MKSKFLLEVEIVKKCRYSIDGNCTNENVACEKCNSTEIEMESCASLQKCIIVYGDNWMIDETETKEI